ncbi:MAG: phosphonoacetaldehyde reductase [Clostridia bacterium]
MYTPFCPVDVRVAEKKEGLNAVRELLQGAKHKLLVLVPRELCGTLSLAPFFTALQGDGHAVQLITEIPSNPTVNELFAKLDALRCQAFLPTTLLAIGGGSCMDMAKGISAMLHLPNTQSLEGVRKAILEKAYCKEHPMVDLLCMPTTSGTGSEVTKWATIWDTDNRQKLSIDCCSCFAKAAILIPEWTVGMPPSLTLSTGLDALSHAMEAFWSVQRTPLAQALSFTAIQKVHEFLPKVLKSPDSIAFRREMSLASLLAGLAFSQTHTTACHSISYPLTMLFGIAHGYAAALTLPGVMRRNEKIMPEIETIRKIFDADGGFSAWLEPLCMGIQTLRLSAFGIAKNDIAAIVALTFTAGRMDNNPICFTASDVADILNECL